MKLEVKLEKEDIELIVDKLLVDREFKEVFARILCEEAMKDPTSHLHEFVNEMIEKSKSDIQRQVELTVQVLKNKIEN